MESSDEVSTSGICHERPERCVRNGCLRRRDVKRKIIPDSCGAEILALKLSGRKRSGSGPNASGVQPGATVTREILAAVSHCVGDVYTPRCRSAHLRTSDEPAVSRLIVLTTFVTWTGGDRVGQASSLQRGMPTVEAAARVCEERRERPGPSGVGWRRFMRL